MLLADYLFTLPIYQLLDMYEMLYQPDVPMQLDEEEYRAAIRDYWDNPANWDELVSALSTTERQTMTRLALHEHCPINAFMEELSGLGLLILYRARNRYEVPDDIRQQLLERLPNLSDMAAMQSEDDGEGTASI